MEMENLMPQGNDKLSGSSPLFWLSLIAVVGIVFLGGRFLAAPRVAAAGFGVPLDDGNGVAFAYCKGIRDIFSGLVGLPFLIAGRRRALASIILIATIIPITDGFIMMRFSGPRADVSLNSLGSRTLHDRTRFFPFSDFSQLINPIARTRSGRANPLAGKGR